MKPVVLPRIARTASARAARVSSSFRIEGGRLRDCGRGEDGNDAKCSQNKFYSSQPNAAAWWEPGRRIRGGQTILGSLELDQGPRPPTSADNI